MKKLIFTSILIAGILRVSQAQHQITYNGDNGATGLSGYGVYTLANSGQATLGAEGNGDLYANLNLGSNISGTRRFWHISKRKSINNHDLRFYFYDGSAFNSLYTFSSNGNLGIGTTSPAEPIHVQDASGAFTFGRPGAEMNNRLTLDASTGYENQIYFRSRPGRIFTGGTTLTLGISASASNLVISNSGNIGIGTSSPDKPFVVKSSGFAPTSGGVHFVHSNGTQGIEFGYAGFKKTTTNGFGNLSIDAADSDNLLFQTQNSGNVGIGTTSPLSKLSVNGQIRATEVKVLADITVPDYVFEPDYNLRTLKETKEYIAENKHLPEIPSAAEIGENGIDLGDMNMKLLKKIEELTLYLIEQKEDIEELKKKVSHLEKE